MEEEEEDVATLDDSRHSAGLLTRFRLIFYPFTHTMGEEWSEISKKKELMRRNWRRRRRRGRGETNQH
jgi:hypothetical protein